MLNGTILTILIVALSGYLFNYFCITKKYLFRQATGHHLLYKCLGYGLLFLAISTLIFSYTWQWTKQSSLLFDLAAIPFPDVTQAQFNLASILVVSVLLSILMAKIKTHSLMFLYRSRFSDKPIPPSFTKKQWKEKLNHFYDLETYMQSTNNAYISHIIEACINPHLILLTLNSRRCYVGYPYSVTTPDGHQESKELVIIPLLSGYRDENDLCLEITTEYTEVKNLLEKEKNELNTQTLIEGNRKLASYKVTIPHENVYSISSYKHSKYRDFKNKENARRAEIKDARDPKDKNRWSLKSFFTHL